MLYSVVQKTGSSALSLNKLGIEGAASTPRSARLLSPSSAIAPIVESHESAPPHSESSPTQLDQKPSATPRQSSKTKPKPPQKPIASQTLPRSLHYKQVEAPSPTKEHRSSVASDLATDEGEL